MSNVINLSCITNLDLPADRILEGVVGRVNKVVLMGYDKDGKEYFASSIADGADVVWLAERMKKQLLEMNE